MTKTAYVLQQIAQGADPPEILQANHFDEILQDFLCVTFDVFRQYGYSLNESPLPAIGNHEQIDAVLEKEWAYWREVLSALATGTAGTSVVESWKSSVAWPVYFRSLTKRCDLLTLCQSNQFGDIPVFYAGQPQPGRVTLYPVYLEPLLLGTRVLAVVQNIYSDVPAKIDLFDQHGNLYGNYEEAWGILANLRYDIWLSENEDFEGGIVFDGIVHSNARRYDVFDVKPLVKFSAAKLYALYANRRALLEDLKEFTCPERHLWVMPARLCGDSGDIGACREHWNDTGLPVKGYVAKHPNGAYPHTRGEEWISLTA